MSDEVEPGGTGQGPRTTPVDEAQHPPSHGASVPVTGDDQIDRAVQDLADCEPDDLDAHLEAGERLQQTLRDRLSDLGS